MLNTRSTLICTKFVSTLDILRNEKELLHQEMDFFEWLKRKHRSRPIAFESWVEWMWGHAEGVQWHRKRRDLPKSRRVLKNWPIFKIEFWDNIAEGVRSWSGMIQEIQETRRDLAKPQSCRLKGEYIWPNWGMSWKIGNVNLANLAAAASLTQKLTRNLSEGKAFGHLAS